MPLWQVLVLRLVLFGFWLTAASLMFVLAYEFSENRLFEALTLACGVSGIWNAGRELLLPVPTPVKGTTP